MGRPRFLVLRAMVRLGLWERGMRQLLQILYSTAPPRGAERASRLAMKPGAGTWALLSDSGEDSTYRLNQSAALGSEYRKDGVRRGTVTLQTPPAECRRSPFNHRRTPPPPASSAPPR